MARAAIVCMYICAYMCIHTCAYYIYIYIYKRERERESTLCMYTDTYIFFYIHICIHRAFGLPKAPTTYCFQSSSLYGFHSRFLLGTWVSLRTRSFTGCCKGYDEGVEFQRHYEVSSGLHQGSKPTILKTSRLHTTRTRNPQAPETPFAFNPFSHRTPMSKSTGMGLRFFCAYRPLNLPMGISENRGP